MKLDMGKDNFSIKLYVFEIKVRMFYNLIIYLFLFILMKRK